ncbi:MAG: transcription initiation protein [Pyrinomonadaceae bacterium]|nr:transcription initiation protein [Pyrinomonadaceae bacterium]
MNTYMLLLHDSINLGEQQNGNEVSAEDMQAIIGDYVGWRSKVEANGRLVGGEKLGDEGGRHIRMTDGEIRVTDGPFAEVKEALGGYFAIKAADYDEAVEISKGCPHLKYGGWIELREVDETH